MSAICICKQILLWYFQSAIYERMNIITVFKLNNCCKQLLRSVATRFATTVENNRHSYQCNFETLLAHKVKRHKIKIVIWKFWNQFYHLQTNIILFTSDYMKISESKSTAPVWLSAVIHHFYVRYTKIIYVTSTVIYAKQTFYWNFETWISCSKLIQIIWVQVWQSLWLVLRKIDPHAFSSLGFIGE